MAGGAFDPAEFAAFKSAPAAPSAPAAAPAFDPNEFAAFKSLPTAPAVDTGASAGTKALDALSPFYEKGVSTRNSAGQFTPEARAVLSRQGINPDLIDHKAEKGLVDQFEAKSMLAGDQSAAVGRGIINGIPVVGPSILGGTNKAVAFVRAVQNGTKYDDELRHVESFGERTAKENPGSTTAGEIGGGIVGTMPLVAAAPAAFGAGAGGLLARSAASMGTGAAIGGADAGARTGDLAAAGQGALLGGALGGAAPAIAAGVGRVVGGAVGRAVPAEAAPTIDALKSDARAAYQRADDAGVQIAQPSFSAAIQDIGDTARTAGLDRTIHPKATAALSRLEEAASTSPTLQNIDLLRRVAKSAAGSIEPDEKRLGSMLVEKLDDYVNNLKSTDLVSGDAKAATDALGEARGLWGRARRGEQIENAVEGADLRSASTGSGGNANNATRQAIRRILENPKLSAGYSAEEKAQMEAIVRGSGMQNALRLIGKLSPQGNGLMAALGLGATAANPLMAAAPAAGIVAKKLADRGTMRGVEALSDMVRRGGAAPVSEAAQAAQAEAERLAQYFALGGPAYAGQRQAER